MGHLTPDGHRVRSSRRELEKPPRFLVGIRPIASVSHFAGEPSQCIDQGEDREPSLLARDLESLPAKGMAYTSLRKHLCDRFRVVPETGFHGFADDVCKAIPTLVTLPHEGL